MLFSVILIIASFLQAFALFQSVKFASQLGPRSAYLYISLTMLLFLSYTLIILYTSDFNSLSDVRKGQTIVILIISFLTVISLHKIRPIIVANKKFSLDLQKKEQQLIQARNIANLCFWEWNIETDQLKCSEKLKKLLGCSNSDEHYYWEDFLQYIHPEDQIAFREQVNSTIYDKATLNFQHRIKAANGQIYHVREYAETNYDNQGRPQYLLGTLQNITEEINTSTHLAEINERVKKQQTELSHASRMATLGEMASGIAHEINQPLSAIVNYANGGKRRITDGKMDADVYFELLGQISQQAERAAEIIKRIRAFVRKEDVTLNEINISDLIKRVVELICNTTNVNSSIFNISYADDLPRLRLDAIQIEQVFTNLILNSIEAMDFANTHYQLISISVYNKSRHAININISDTGPGFPEESINQV